MHTYINLHTEYMETSIYSASLHCITLHYKVFHCKYMQHGTLEEEHIDAQVKHITVTSRRLEMALLTLSVHKERTKTHIPINALGNYVYVIVKLIPLEIELNTGPLALYMWWPCSTVSTIQLGSPSENERWVLVECHSLSCSFKQQHRA